MCRDLVASAPGFTYISHSYCCWIWKPWMNFPFGAVAPLTLHALLIDQIDLLGNMVLKVAEPTKKVWAQTLVSSPVHFITVAPRFKRVAWASLSLSLSLLQEEIKLKATPTPVFVISPHPHVSALSDNARWQWFVLAWMAALRRRLCMIWQSTRFKATIIQTACNMLKSWVWLPYDWWLIMKLFWGGQNKKQPPRFPLRQRLIQPTSPALGCSVISCFQAFQETENELWISGSLTVVLRRVCVCVWEGGRGGVESTDT